MFKQRLLTSLILIPLVLWAIYSANYWTFLTIFSLLIIGSAWEWSSLLPLKLTWQRGVFLGLSVFFLLLSQYHVTAWLTFGLIIWFLVLLAIITFPQSQSIWGYPIVVAFAAFLFLALCFQALLQITQTSHGKMVLIYLLFLVWSADIGAYVAGKLCGKHKLIPHVSPGKTVEGLFGGVSLSLLIALIAYCYFRPAHLLAWFVLALMTSLISLVGDLFISMLKRRVGLKDTGHLLPGHGGLLDRLDSLIAAAPLFYCGLVYLPLGL